MVSGQTGLVLGAIVGGVFRGSYRATACLGFLLSCAVSGVAWLYLK